jgi:hypothetical protein
MEPETGNPPVEEEKQVAVDPPVEKIEHTYSELPSKVLLLKLSLAIYSLGPKNYRKVWVQ